MDKKAYISGALTGVPNAKELQGFYELLGGVCETRGYKVYIPHQNSDPIAHKDITPKEVDEMDRREVSKANIMITYVGVASLGVGLEIEFARQAKTKVILLYAKTDVVSRLPKGNPAVVCEIEFTDFEDALEQLSDYLDTLS